MLLLPFPVSCGRALIKAETLRVLPDWMRYGNLEYRSFFWRSCTAVKDLAHNLPFSVKLE